MAVAWEQILTRISKHDERRVRIAFGALEINDREFFALLDDAKPAQRGLVRHSQAPILIKLYNQFGLHVTLGDFALDSNRGLMSTRPLASPQDRIVFYAAKQAEHAAYLKDLERRTLDEKPSFTENTEKLGLALGYPACCIRFFLQHHHLTTPEFHFAVIKQTNGSAVAELNPFEPKRLISHEPCSLNCKESIQIAKQINLAQPQPLSREELCGSYISFSSGAWVKLETTGDRRRIVRYRCLNSSEGSYPGTNSNNVPPQALWQLLQQHGTLHLGENKLTVSHNGQHPIALKGRNKQWQWVEFV